MAKAAKRSAEEARCETSCFTQDQSETENANRGRNAPCRSTKVPAKRPRPTRNPAPARPRASPIRTPRTSRKWAPSARTRPRRSTPRRRTSSRIRRTPSTTAIRTRITRPTRRLAYRAIPSPRPVAEGITVPPEELLTEQEKEAAGGGGDPRAGVGPYAPSRSTTGPAKTIEDEGIGPRTPVPDRQPAAAQRLGLAVAGHLEGDEEEDAAPTSARDSRHPRCLPRRHHQGRLPPRRHHRRRSRPRQGPPRERARRAAGNARHPSRSSASAARRKWRPRRRRTADDAETAAAADGRHAGGANQHEAKPRYTGLASPPTGTAASPATTRTLPRRCRPIANSHSATVENRLRPAASGSQGRGHGAAADTLHDLGKDYGRL